jgi:hypothetical protein
LRSVRLARRAAFLQWHHYSPTGLGPATYYL